jgi:inhibitor of KinA sporulation pathway (predicted exonuclease)
MAGRLYAPKYNPPKFNFQQLPTAQVDYYLVLDFEANNDRDSRYVVKEIIEFPVIKVNSRTLQTESEFHTYVQPTAYPRIDPFITELCGITQDKVDGKPELPVVLVQFDAWMKSEGLLKEGVKSCFVTCGDWDLKTALPTNCDYLKLGYPDYLKRWINIKSCFETTMKKRAGGMEGMLRDLGLRLDGRHHSGIDDSRNIAKILCELASRNERLRNGLIEPRELVAVQRQ